MSKAFIKIFIFWVRESTDGFDVRFCLWSIPAHKGLNGDFRQRDSYPHKRSLQIGTKQISATIWKIGDRNIVYNVERQPINMCCRVVIDRRYRLTSDFHLVHFYFLGLIYFDWLHHRSSSNLTKTRSIIMVHEYLCPGIYTAILVTHTDI